MFGGLVQRIPLSVKCCVGAVLTGVLLALAFPPMEWRDLAWVALCPLLLVGASVAPRNAFKWGFVGGLVFWLVSLQWLLSLARTGTTLPAAVCAWGLLSAYCALYVGLFLFCVSGVLRMAGRRLHPWAGQWWRRIGVLLLLPLLWIGSEFVRARFLTGFPWNLLGVSQATNIPVIQLAEFCGVYGISGLVVLANGAVAATIWRIGDRGRNAKCRGNLEIMFALLCIAAAWTYGIRRIGEVRGVDSGRTFRIAAVQPNIPQLKKWPRSFAEEIYSRLFRQTRLASATEPDLIVWPETAIPELVEGPMPGPVQEMAREVGPILVGAMEVVRPVGGGERWYNSAFLVDRDGRIVEKYRKIHLVPFGEYLPLDKKLEIMRRIAPLGFSCYSGERVTVFPLRKRRGTDSSTRSQGAFASLICFEDAFAYLSRWAVKRGARLLVNQTNDAWFDGTSGAVQHLRQCVFRCVENRVGAVRSANTGITAFIDRVGYVRILRAEDVRARRGGTQVRGGGRTFGGFKTESVAVPGDGFRETCYTRYGDALLGLPCGLIFIFGVLFVYFCCRAGEEPATEEGSIRGKAGRK